MLSTLTNAVENKEKFHETLSFFLRALSLTQFSATVVLR